MKYLMSLMIFIVALLLNNTTTQAVNWNVIFGLCPEEIIHVPPLIERLPIPVGCEIVDCCPGCPGPGPLDWEITIDGKRLDGAVLRFDGLSDQDLKQLKFSGNAMLEGDSIIIGQGTSVISGLPDTLAGSVPVGFIKPMISDKDADILKKPVDGVSKTNTDSDIGDSSSGISITQYLGGFQVNRFRAGYILRPCHSGQPSTDKLRIVNNTDGDTTVTMIDYRDIPGTAGCIDDQIIRTVEEQDMGNIVRSGSCNSEISVFSDNNAMAFNPSVTTWTNSSGDVHTVSLQPMINVPVSVWITNNASAPVAVNDFANANLLYNQNNVGIQFNPTYNNVSANSAAVTAVGGGGCDATSLSTVQGSTWYNPNTMNIYYVAGAFTGKNCINDRNISYIATIANLGSLPHEIGHTYGLAPSASWGHTNGLAGFGNNNIMWGGGPGTRNNFSVGQAFRINVDQNSMLNVNGNRTGATRNCPPNVSNQFCPILRLDSLPH